MKVEDTVFAPTLQALDKAKGVQDAINNSATDTAKAIDGATTDP